MKIYFLLKKEKKCKHATLRRRRNWRAAAFSERRNKTKMVNSTGARKDKQRQD